MERRLKLSGVGLEGSRRRVTAHVLGGVVGALILTLAGTAQGWDRYSVAKDATNCRACHGDFRAATYTASDGLWVDGLHDTHENDMLDGDCDTCHSAGPPFPVLIGSSAGGTGLPAISCSGCHGRAEDGTGTGSEGYGAGLRQHHWRNGVTSCGIGGCHADANPANYTPVGEEVLPPYYADNDPDHPDIPLDPCNTPDAGLGGPGPYLTEDYAASTLGLDNDGDLLFDQPEESICLPEPDGTLLLVAGVGFLGVIGRRRWR